MELNKRFLYSKQKLHGFTLVELLVSIAIIAIVSSFGLVTFRNSQQSAKDLKKKADVDAIAKAYEATYNARTGTYGEISGTNFANGDIPRPPEGGDYPGCTSGASPCTSWRTPDSRSFIVSTPLSTGENYLKSSISNPTPTMTPTPTVTLTPSATPTSTNTPTPTPPLMCSTITAWSSNPSAIISGCGVNQSALQSLGIPVDGSGTVYLTCPAVGDWGIIDTLNYCSYVNSNNFVPTRDIFTAYSGGTFAQGAIFGRGTATYLGGDAKLVQIKQRPSPTYCPNFRNGGTLVGVQQCKAWSDNNSGPLPAVLYVDCPATPVDCSGADACWLKPTLQSYYTSPTGGTQYSLVNGGQSPTVCTLDHNDGAMKQVEIRLHNFDL